MLSAVDANQVIEDLREQLADAKEQLRQKDQIILELQAQVRELQAQVKVLQDMAFGKSSEKKFSKDSQDPLLPVPKKNPKKRQDSPKRRNHDHLPVREERVDLPEDQKVCPHCGTPYKHFKDVIEGETIEIEVKPHRRRVKRPCYAQGCKCCGVPKILTTPAPGKLIAKGGIGTSIWIKLLLDKFLFYTPTYRSIEQMNLEGIHLAQSTINDGMHKIMNLLKPIYDWICEKNREEEKWNADETIWLVQEKQKGKETTRWYIWVFKGLLTTVYRLSKTRGSETIANHLGTEIDGTISCDRYSAYKKYAGDSKGNISLSHCWAHVRRDFLRLGNSYPAHRQWAYEIVENEIGTLYQKYRERKKAYQNQQQNPEAYEIAQEAFSGEINRFFDKREQELSSLLDECRIKVIESLLKHRHSLTEVMVNPELDMDNNAAERALRGPVIGRKNYWGSMTEWSGQLAVMMFTIIQTLLLWDINPKKWLELYFTACAQNKSKAPSNIESYLPWNMSEETLASYTDNDIPGPSPPT